MNVLQFDAVTKRFGDFTAVNELSFAVPQGQVFGFLGGNGAGKTTSLRMVLDIIRPTAGRIEVLGKPAGRESHADLGFLPEERGLYQTMTALDTITYFGRLKGMTRHDARTEGKALLDRFGLGDNAKMPIAKLSKGMAQKVQVATAVVNRPRLLILDEPFSGLDPVNQGLLEAEISRMRATGATVVFSTHVMQHAERLCDRLLLLAKGKKRFEGTQEEARAQLPTRLSIVSRASPAGLPGVEQAMQTPSSIEGVGDAGWMAWDVRLAPGGDAAQLLQHITEQGFALRGFQQHRATLHDVFIHVVGGEEVLAPGEEKPETKP